MFLSTFLLIIFLNCLQFYLPSFANFCDPQDKENAVKERLEELNKLMFSSGNFYFSQFQKEGEYYGAYFVEADEQNDWDISKGGYLHNGKHLNIDIEFGKNNKTGNLECFYYAWNLEQPENPAEKAQFLLVENSLKSSKMAVYVDRIGWGQPDVSKDYFRTIPLMFLPPDIPPPLNRVELGEMMNSMDVHDILRICSTAYFYRGFSKEDTKKRHRLLRKDWNLFLMEGTLKCNLNYDYIDDEDEKNNSSAGNGNKLLAKGFIVYLYQINSDMYENSDNPSKCAFEALLSQYIQEGQILLNDDERLKDGFNFHLAAIVGSAQLTNVGRDFWKWKKTDKTIKNTRRNVYVVEDEWDDCAKNYAKSLRSGELDYMLRIEFHHKCATDSEGEKLICKFTIDQFRVIDNFVRQIIYISILIGIPSLLLYCSQCLVIFWHRQFHNAFYVLFVVRASQDILLLLSSYVHYRLTFIAGTFLLPFYLCFPNWLLVSMLIFYYYSMEASSLATTFLLLNRLSAIIFPLGHEKLWRKLLPPILVIIFGAPLYFGRYFFGMQCWFQNYIETDSFLLYVTHLIFLVICSIINLAIFIAYRRQQSLIGNNGNQQQQMQRKTESKLIVYAVCTFISHMLLTLLMIGYYLALQMREWVIVGALLVQTPWVFDLGGILMPSWLLLWASADFRQQWCRHFLPKWLQRRQQQATNTVNVLPAALWKQK